MDSRNLEERIKVEKDRNGETVTVVVVFSSRLFQSLSLSRPSGFSNFCRPLSLEQTRDLETWE